MSLRWRNLVAPIAFAMICARFCSPQQTPPEKSVAQIKKEQTPEVLAASPLCQWAAQEIKENTAKGKQMAVDFDNKPILDRPIKDGHDSFLPDLKSLFDASDEVVLAAPTAPSLWAISPSGERVVTYFDVQVLRSWKGGRKAGDTLTFAIPGGAVECPWAGVSTSNPRYNPTGSVSFQTVLFLRQSTGTETQTTPGLRLTGADGLQGAIPFVSPTPFTSMPKACAGLWYVPESKDEEIRKCNEFIDSDSTGFALFGSPHDYDPIAVHYDHTPVPVLLRELQSLAESSGSDPNN